MSLVNTTDATEADLEVLRDQLGRVPRGVVGIAARCVWRCARAPLRACAPTLPRKWSRGELCAVIDAVRYTHAMAHLYA